MTAPDLSFEFFPPKTEKGLDNLTTAAAALAEKNPAFFSVTYGAGGSTQDGTLKAIQAVTEKTGVAAAHHFTCVGSTRANVTAQLDNLLAAGVNHLVALRGDLPEGMNNPGQLRYATDLIRLIRDHSGNAFRISVAAYPESHPESPNPDTDLMRFLEKVEAGANHAITQYFFNTHAYYDFVERSAALGIEIPIVPGIMPITNFTQLARFSDMCGAEIPRWIRLRLEAWQDDLPSLQAFGTEVVANICEELIDNGVPGLHFYSLNKADPSLNILNRLG